MYVVVRVATVMRVAIIGFAGGGVGWGFPGVGIFPACAESNRGSGGAASMSSRSLVAGSSRSITSPLAPMA